MTINWTSRIIGLIGAINTALIAFDIYHLSDEQLQAVIALISVVITIVGVWLPHLAETEGDADDETDIH